MNQNFVALSLETHLFFGRIMKEHALFLMAGFPTKNAAYTKRADWFRVQFEQLLRETVQMSSGMVGESILQSDELVTEFTVGAEQRTSFLTGVCIDSRITEAEKCLIPSCRMCFNTAVEQRIRRLNDRALQLIGGLIEFKEKVLADMASCRLFTFNYPLLIEHIIREARLYQCMTAELNEKGTLSEGNIWKMEAFWNQIMMEHALFIRGLLDPSEEELINAADGFARDYRRLLEEARQKNCRTVDGLTEKTMEETVRYRDFKAAGTKGISECQIAGLILPLLADHVLREANHYLRILESVCEN